MQSLVMTLIGTDKTGLVDTLAKTVKRFDGNWQGSRLAHMAGQFAGFVEVAVPQANADDLVDAISALPDLTIHMVTVKDQQQAPQQIANFSIMGNDKPGIVSEITAVLQQFDINIMKFSSECVSAPNWGSLMFQAEFSVALPEGADSDDIQDALEAIANDLVVDITFK